MRDLVAKIARATGLAPRLSSISIRFIRKGGWLGEHLSSNFEPPRLTSHARVDERLKITAAQGGKPLWEGYKDVKNYPRATSGDRSSAEVRTEEDVGRFFSWLANQRAPSNIVEFGTAFGASGMYWLAGIEDGHLFTFEPNEVWANIAEENLRAISPRFTLTRGIFEKKAAEVLRPQSVDMAFIDAIHTSEFVFRQLHILMPFMKPGSIVLFDDISFSDDMQACWRKIASDPTHKAVLEISNRVGVIELP